MSKLVSYYFKFLFFKTEKEENKMMTYLYS